MSDDADRTAIQASAAAVRKGLQELTADLLRVARGSGRPELVLQQWAEFVALASAHRDATGYDPSVEDIGAALKLEHVLNDGDETCPDWDPAVRDMVSGALQVAAAELLAQRAPLLEHRTSDNEN